MEAGRCTEARACIAGNLLKSYLVDNDVESWTAESIVLRNDAPCATEVFTIDLNTEAVSGAGRLINKDSLHCKMYPVEEESWRYLWQFIKDVIAVYPGGRSRGTGGDPETGVAA